MSDSLSAPRLRVGVMLATVSALALLGSAGCSSAKDKAGAGPVESTAPSASVAATTDGSAPGGGLVKYADLNAFTPTMPKPKGVPQDGIWSEAEAGQDGSEAVN